MHPDFFLDDVQADQFSQDVGSLVKSNTTGCDGHKSSEKISDASPVHEKDGDCGPMDEEQLVTHSVHQPPAARIRTVRENGRTRLRKSGSSGLASEPPAGSVPGLTGLAALPHTTDFDAVLELERVEETENEDGSRMKVWRCSVCNIRFQFFASFDKHRENEHPDSGTQFSSYVNNVDSDRDGDTTYQPDDSDSEPMPRRTSRRKQSRMRENDTESVHPKVQQSRKSGRVANNRTKKSQKSKAKQIAVAGRANQKTKTKSSAVTQDKCPDCDEVLASHAALESIAVAITSCHSRVKYVARSLRH